MSDTELNVAIKATDETGSAVESSEKRMDAFSQMFLQMTREVTGEISKMTGELSKIGSTMERATNDIGKHTHATHKNLNDLEDGFHKLGASVERAFSPGHLVEELGDSVLRVVGPLAILEAGVESVHAAFERLVDFAKEGIAKADEVRDLQLSLGVVSGGAGKASEAMEFFEKRMDSTRNTGEELGKTLRNIGPLLESRGFSPAAQEHLVMTLSQLATIRGVSMEDMESSV